MKKETCAGIGIGIIGMIIFIILLIYHHIQATHFCILVSVFILLSLAIWKFPQIREVDLSRLKLTLRQVEGIRDDVIATKDELQKLAIALARLISFRCFFEGRGLGDESIKIVELGTIKLFNNLIDETNISPVYRDEILKYLNARQQGKTWQEILKIMRADMELPDDAFRNIKPD